MDPKRKIRDLALLIPLAGILLISPLAFQLVLNAGSALNLPLYIFTVWFLLIAAAYLISSQLNPRLLDDKKQNPKTDEVSSQANETNLAKPSKRETS